ncbi:zinc finger protein 11-like [Cydia pomonella]|uniref:zinc finger protein 11-like n=1 Tax=Cydia pomonella TaxID=82600 RepID=UPI002ADD7B46|nr:zinc finger protein 11-like [Cydia pomonella]
MKHICVICTLRKPPLTPLATEHRELLEAIVSPAITMADLSACEILLCMDCQEKLQSIQQFQKMALNGLTVLKSVLSKVNNAPTVQDQKIQTLIEMKDGRKLLVNPISVVETIITEPELEEPASLELSATSPGHPHPLAEEMDIKSEQPAFPEQPCLDVELKLEVQSKHETGTEFEPEIELKSEHYEFDSESEFDNASLSRSVAQCDSDSKMKTEECDFTRVQNIAFHTRIMSPLQTNHVYKTIENKYKPAILKQAHRPPKEPRAAKVGIIARAYAAKQAKAALKASANAAKQVNVASEGAHGIIEANVASEEAQTVEEVNIASVASDNAFIEMTVACTTEMANEAEKANATNITTEANAAVEKEKERESKKSERVQCALCDKVLCHKRSFRQHYYLRHAEANPVKCELCHKQFRNAGVLRYHQCPHKKAAPRPAPRTWCAECARQFPTRAQYRAHLLTLKHTPRALYKFECEVCKKRFRHRRWMRDHLDAAHRGLKKYSCDRCDSSFGSFTSLRRHVARDHDKVVAPRATHVCDLCGKTFKVKKSLEEHLLSHYGLRPFTCAAPACAAAFCYRAALYTHTRLKHAPDKKGRKDQEHDEQMDDEERPEYLELQFDD